MHVAETVCHFSLQGWEKDLFHILFYTHRHGLGKRVTAWDCITLSIELPPEKKNISPWKMKGTCTPGKLSQPYLLEGKISQYDRASLKTPENTEGHHFTSRAVCQTLKLNILISMLTNPQGRSEGRLLQHVWDYLLVSLWQEGKCRGCPSTDPRAFWM